MQAPITYVHTYTLTYMHLNAFMCSALLALLIAYIIFICVAVAAGVVVLLFWFSLFVAIIALTVIFIAVVAHYVAAALSVISFSHNCCCFLRSPKLHFIYFFYCANVNTYLILLIAYISFLVFDSCWVGYPLDIFFFKLMIAFFLDCLAAKFHWRCGRKSLFKFCNTQEEDFRNIAFLNRPIYQTMEFWQKAPK